MTPKGKYGYPEQYGLDGDKCGNCGSAVPEHRMTSTYGEFCIACFRWIRYTGPKSWWGDGMEVTQ